MLTVSGLNMYHTYNLLIINKVVQGVQVVQVVQDSTSSSYWSLATGHYSSRKWQIISVNSRKSSIFAFGAVYAFSTVCIVTQRVAAPPLRQGCPLCQVVPCWRTREDPVPMRRGGEDLPKG